MSRWFKIVLVLMVLFVLRLALKLNLSRSDQPDEAIRASVLYEAFQTDFEAAMDTYAGERVTVEGEICDIVDQESGFVIYLSDGGYGRQQALIECYPTVLRHYPRNRFYEGQFASIYGKVKKEQDTGWVTLVNCQIFGT
ncbi:MAG: hypothetical protein JSW34_10285 [Candidatus Zixiibacteriota bacterium]|nr:MAG: hypothetical protein JSW34_10285 [candidate division Zixibacteria bacterium]